jgi:hypothetical protein
MCGARVMQQPFVFLAALWDGGLVRLCRGGSTARHNMGMGLRGHEVADRHRWCCSNNPKFNAPKGVPFGALEKGALRF